MLAGGCLVAYDIQLEIRTYSLRPNTTTNVRGLFRDIRLLEIDILPLLSFSHADLYGVFFNIRNIILNSFSFTLSKQDYKCVYQFRVFRRIPRNHI